MNKAPCKNCERRCVGCHSKCDDYAEFKAYKDKENHYKAELIKIRREPSQWTKSLLRKRERNRRVLRGGESE